MSNERKIPESRLGRFARLATVGLRTGASLLIDRDGSSTAKRAADVFGTMRGLAAKVGQMASYVDGVVPEEQREAYESAMKTLRSAAPHSSPALVRETLETELGGPIDKLFSEWKEPPIASASIGQVHFAKLHDGREVAVKVQHPGVANAVESDLLNASMFEGMIDVFGGGRLNAKEQFDIVRKRFREELDYVNEANNIRYFGKLFEADGNIHIPLPVDGYCSPSVLTTEFVRGMSFDAACEAPATSRGAWAETMWRFVFRGNLVGGAFNADPHPGNYLFHENGKVSFLDFGCVQPIEKEHLRLARVIHVAAANRDEGEFRAAASGLIGARKGRLETYAVDYIRICFEPLLNSPYRITRDYAASLVREFKDMGARSLKLPKEEFFHLPAEMLFMNRLQFGFYSVLARLDVDADYSAVERSFFHEFPTR